LLVLQNEKVTNANLVEIKLSVVEKAAWKLHLEPLKGSSVVAVCLLLSKSCCKVWYGVACNSKKGREVTNGGLDKM